MNKAVLHDQTRDTKMCCEYACSIILDDTKMFKLATATLRPQVLQRLQCGGEAYFKGLLKRHAPFVALPKPVRGRALDIAASELGLVTRVETVRVDVATVKEECKLARSRKQMNMPGEIGRECTSRRVVVHKTKRKKCIQKIVTFAQQTGVADITLVWREFSACSNTMVEVALEAIAAGCSLNNVYVLDIHKQTYLFAFPIFKKMIDLLTKSCIFAINMGENNMILASPHFKLLAAKINDGSLALRRWFVESNPQRRSILVTYKLVSKQRSTRTMGNADNPNVWTIARRRDKALWTEGQRHHARLSWLNAPQSAFDGANTYKTDMQNSTCNWSNACALREYAESNCGTALCS